MWPANSRPTIPACRAVVAAAVVLIVSLLVGWLVIRNKVAAPAVELAEPELLEPLGIRARLPVDWGRITKTVHGITLVELNEPGPAATRKMLLARWPSDYSQHRHLDRSWKWDFVEAGYGGLHATEELKPAHIGPLVAWQSEGLWVDQRSREGAIARAAWSPDGHAYLFVHLAPAPLRGSERKLFARLVENVELTDLALQDSLGDAGNRLGMHFDVPAGARVFRSEKHDAARVDLVPVWREGLDDPAERDWHVVVFRTWARDGDDLESLVAAYRAEQLQDFFLNEPVEHVTVGVNEAWRSSTRMPERLPAELRVAMEVWAVRHREGDAAMIIGRAPGPQHASLRRRCESLARSLRLSGSELVPGDDQIDRTAAEIVAEIRDEGLSHWWTEGEVTTWYEIRASGRRGFGWYHRQRHDGGEGRGKGFEGGGLNRIRLGLLGAPRYQDNLYRWRIDDHADGFQFNQWLPAVDEDDRAIHLTDERPTDSDRVQHYIRAGEQRYQGGLETPETFLPDPVFQLGLFLLSQRSPGTVAGFSMIGSSERMLHRRICRSLGRIEDEQDGRGGPMFGATARLDCEPTTTRYLFDRNGRLLRVEEGLRYTMVQASKAEVEDVLDDPSVVADILETHRTTPWLGTGIDAPPTTSTRPATEP